MVKWLIAEPLYILMTTRSIEKDYKKNGLEIFNLRLKKKKKKKEKKIKKCVMEIIITRTGMWNMF